MDYKLSILTGNKKTQLIAAGNPVAETCGYTFV